MEYVLSTNIPKNIFRKVKFEFYEELDPALTYITQVKNIQLLKNEDVVDSKNYSVSINGQILKVSLTKDYLASLTKEDGESTFSVEFRAKVNSKAVIDKAIDNTFTIKFNNGEGVDLEEKSNITKVIVGGKKFKKTNLSHLGLEGAEFIVQDLGRERTLYLCENENKEFYWDINKENAKKFTSGEEGAFEVAGLEPTNKVILDKNNELKETDEEIHKYQLVEVKAPQGYALLKDAIDFDIIMGDYSKEEGNIQEILNKKLIIPQTGAFGSIGIILTGLGISAIAFKKMREQ